MRKPDTGRSSIREPREMTIASDTHVGLVSEVAVPPPF
jgi:hypothetical protein